MCNPIFKFDFQKDFREYCEHFLLSYGVELPDSPMETKVMYWKIYQRLIHGKQPRKIYKSLYIQSNIDKDLSKGLSILEGKVEKGENINSHLSSLSLTPPKSNFNDGMLNDWGIHHFHLGTSYDKNGLIERTSQLLYAIVTQDGFYEICLAEHGRWTDKQLLQIVYDNWGNLLKRFSIPDIQISKDVPSEMLKKLRSACINTPVTLDDGTVLLCPGGGISTNGTSSIAIELLDRFDLFLQAQTESFNSTAKQQSLIDYCKENNPSLVTITEISVNMVFDDNDIFNPKINISGLSLTEEPVIHRE